MGEKILTLRLPESSLKQNEDSPKPDGLKAPHAHTRSQISSFPIYRGFDSVFITDSSPETEIIPSHEIRNVF